jgi:hypothetical protein
MPDSSHADPDIPRGRHFTVVIRFAVTFDQLVSL